MNKHHYINIFIIILVTLFLSIQLLNDKLDVCYDDGIQHIIRISETIDDYKNGSDGNILINLCNNFGYSWNIFYGPMTVWIAMLFSFFTNSSVVLFKITLAFILFLSGISMYIACLKISKNSNIGLIAAILYMCAPYHLTDLYSRYAIAEFMAFVFIPLAFAGLDSILIKKNQDWYLLIIGMSGLILTHMISTMYTVIFLIVFSLINYKTFFCIESFKKIIISVMFVICITCCFWEPLLEHKLATDYMVFEDNIMSTVQSVNENRIDFKELFVNQNDNFLNLQLGIPIIILLILTPFFYRKIDTENKKLVKIFLVLGCISLIMCTKIVNWGYLPKIFLNIQFPWRMLMFSSFFFSFVCAETFYCLGKKYMLLDSLLIIIILLTTLLGYNKGLKYNESKVEDPIPAIITENNLNINAGCAKFEYLPKKAYENRSYIANREDRTYVITGDATIQNESKSGKNLSCNITVNEDKTKLELPYIYYLGYEININGNTYNYKESENGFLEIELNTGEYELEILYTGTDCMKISKFISILGAVIFVIYTCYLKKNSIKCLGKEVKLCQNQ